MKTRHFGLRLTEEQHARLEELAQETGVRSTSEVVRQLIDAATVEYKVVPRLTFEAGGRNGRVAA